MSTELESQIRNLQEELAEVKNEQAHLRLQPCRGDAEIRRKDAKFEELNKQAKAINEAIRVMKRKRQLPVFESTVKGKNESFNSYKSS